MNEKVKVFKAIGDETRLKILILLSSKNVCAKGIAKAELRSVALRTPPAGGVAMTYGGERLWVPQGSRKKVCSSRAKRSVASVMRLWEQPSKQTYRLGAVMEAL